MSVQRTIPQMRTPLSGGARRLSVHTTQTARVGVLVLRGDARPDALGPLITAIDGLFAARVGAIVLDCRDVTSWSSRGLEVAVLTATRAHEQRIGFAACGVPEEQLSFVRRQWPGVRVEQFAYPGRRSAEDALLSHA
ncbi:STAS domain-containing protein [Nakamurella deserti]|uniref:STAS domain-containing protein n=1 Tax=Nakamurella deserti TaxID=2164074 RepID=UPI00130074D6|nr:STAS domain-containing protein [Nakamurella deserti]